MIRTDDAAIDAVIVEVSYTMDPNTERVVRDHLRAALPRIRAAALRDAAREMQDGVGEAWDPSRTDYEQQRREAAARRSWLSSRADEIEAGR